MELTDGATHVCMPCTVRQQAYISSLVGIDGYYSSDVTHVLPVLRIHAIVESAEWQYIQPV
jgi:hypothetical protein